jgi:hypothetical protein
MPPARSYVVDAAAGERLDESRAALERVRAAMRHSFGFALRFVGLTRGHPQALASRELEGAPLLLLANKSDIAGASLLQRMPRLSRSLTLRSAPRPRRVRGGGGGVRLADGRASGAPGARG